MNKCKFEKARLKYIYGELSNSDIASFEKHLQGCPLCKEELSFSKSLSSFLKNNLAYGSPSQETISTIKEAGDEVMREITSMESAGVRVIWRYAFGTVGIVLVLSVILFYQRISVTEKTASPVFETKINILEQRVGKLKNDLQKDIDVYDMAISDLRQKTNSLKFEIGEDI